MLQSAVGNQCFSLGRGDQYNVQYRTANNNEDTAKQSILIEKVWMSKSAERMDRMNEIPIILHTARYYTCMGPNYFYYACTFFY